MDAVELAGTQAPDRFALPAAARAAAMISREIAYADPDPDPLALSEFDDRLYRYATTLLSAPHTSLLGPIIGDWRRVQAALARRLSPAVHIELTRVAGYLSFYLGVLSADTGANTSARRFATLTEQFAAQLDDRLLTGTSRSLDAAIAFADGRLDAARAAAVEDPYLHGWAAAAEVTLAAAAGDEPAFDDVREACVVADAMARLSVPGARSAGYRAVSITTPGTLERGWALGALATTLVNHDPATAGSGLDEMVAILDVRPSRLLSTRVHEILLLISSPPVDRAPRTAGAT